MMRTADEVRRKAMPFIKQGKQAFDKWVAGPALVCTWNIEAMEELIRLEEQYFKQQTDLFQK